ncbi:hypothetical protein [Sphingomonas echinoides]|uniref:hypothetical protein n=1 Tax=Sphingomonas echinoides TaxID=59803 RepID=UPI002413B51A|nr:hypothetical protein [Sphingomonas echinoides]
MADAAARQLHILQHSLGVDQYGQGEQYRSHFATDVGSIDHRDCMALFEAGLMKRRASVKMYGGMDAFFVTDEGRAFVAANSPPPPKLTRSQRRYQAWLDADCNLSFIDYCRRAGAGTSA